MKIALTVLLASVLASITHSTPQEVAKILFPKTVLIVVNDSTGKPLALGSGFVLDKGYIVSNYHVIEGAASGYVRRIGDTANYKIAGLAAKDEFRDLVILAVEGIEEDGVALSKRLSAEVGETVFALGNPRGLEGTFSQGIVSSFREIDGFNILQITAPISPGSSGGPIADEYGEVIGVAVATFKGGQNLNFAIPAKYVRELQAKIDTPSRLSDSATATKGKSLLASLDTGRSTDGVSAGSFLWNGDMPDTTLGSNGKFTITLKNNLVEAIRDPVVLVYFHDETGEILDFTVVQYSGLIPAGVGKRASGVTDPSTKQLTTPISKSNQFMYSDRPSTKVEYRILGFEFDSN